VFNADTRQVEGILVAGDPVDLVQKGNCLVSSVCPDTQCLGEEVTRSTQFAQLVPLIPQPPVYKLYLGTCGDLTLRGETARPSFAVTDLSENTDYCWQVVVEDECGETPGPVWTFTTAAAAGPPSFLRGDAAPDGQLNISDPIAVLVHLFEDPSPPSCTEAEDFDDSGTVDLTDVVGLLDYLFLGGVAPAAPFPGCGADPTADGLGCGAYPACGTSG
jgi:hypothetical protein